MEFTRHWHDQHSPAWQELAYYKPPNTYLEIGIYEGASMAWVTENTPVKELTGIDAWRSENEHAHTDMRSCEVRFKQNLQELKRSYPSKRFDIYKLTSEQALPYLLTKQMRYDWIYIDGNHDASAVLLDLTLSWRLLNDDGLVILDDYAWPNDNERLTPKMSIDFFMSIHTDYTIWPQSGYQMIIQKKATK